jgi:Mitochondrial K+-H+ exchange-related
MQVYLVPIGSDRYELYCEVVDVDDDDADGEAAAEEVPAGVVRRVRVGFGSLLQGLRRRFSMLLREAERHRHENPGDQPSPGWASRARTWVLGWVAESMAEQRLLWHLRKQSSACLVHPTDVDGVTAIARLRAQLQRDFQKHRFWLVLDGLFFIGSGVLVIVPGPNLLAYYLGFRLVGHYFSLRGSRRGLDTVTWTTEGSAALTELRTVIRLDPEQRLRRIHDLARELCLEHLASFVERTVPSPS